MSRLDKTAIHRVKVKGLGNKLVYCLSRSIITQFFMQRDRLEDKAYLMGIHIGSTSKYHYFDPGNNPDRLGRLLDLNLR